MNYLGRQNYYKYESVKERLQEELNNDQTSSQIIHTLKIAPLTYHKYKNMLQLETGRQYMTSDERRFIESMGGSTTTGQKPNQLALPQPKKKSPAPAPEPVAQPEQESPPVQAVQEPAAVPTDEPNQASPSQPSTPAKPSRKKSK